MDAVKTEARCTCGPTWFTDDDGNTPTPGCACPIITGFADALYWSLPPNRRMDFEGIEKALCGSKTRDGDELLRRFWVIFACACRVNAYPEWKASGKQQDMLDAIQDSRCTDDFVTDVQRWAEDFTSAITRGGPVSAWLATDDLVDLLVSVENKP